MGVPTPVFPRAESSNGCAQVAHRYGSVEPFPCTRAPIGRKNPHRECPGSPSVACAATPTGVHICAALAGPGAGGKTQGLVGGRLTRPYPLRDSAVASTLLCSSSCEKSKRPGGLIIRRGVLVSTGVRRRHPAVDAARELGLDGERPRNVPRQCDRDLRYERRCLFSPRAPGRC